MTTKALYDGHELLSEAQVYDRAAAYPRLVEAIKFLTGTYVHPKPTEITEEHVEKVMRSKERAVTLLRELGEL